MKQRLTPILFVASFLAIYPACNYAQSKSDQKKSAENMYSTTTDDTQMNNAMVIANSRFGQFDSAFRSRHYDQSKFSIKLRFSNPNGHEYIWITDIALQNGQYWGVLSDTPATSINARLGDRLQIDRKDVADWLYGKDSVLHGGYTIRVLEQRMSKKEREQHNADFPFKLED